LIASPLTDTFAPAAIWNTPEALFPLILSRLAPGPVIVASPFTSNSVPARVIVWPLRLAAKVTVSLPGLGPAASMASRSERSPAPKSPSLSSTALSTTNANDWR
jgi:hypothetical protein